MPILPFKLNQDRRHRSPRQKRKLMDWREYDAGLRQRGSLTVWFTNEAIEGWRAQPRTTPGGQPWCLPLVILTALTLRAVFRLALRRTEGLIGSIGRPRPCHPVPPGGDAGGAAATTAQAWRSPSTCWWTAPA